MLWSEVGQLGLWDSITGRQILQMQNPKKLRYYEGSANATETSKLDGVPTPIRFA